MKQLNITLKDNKALVENTTALFLEKTESIEFVINHNEDDLYYTIGDTMHSITDKRFTLTYDELLNNMSIKITVKSKNTLYPVIYVLEGLQVKLVKVIGETIDERYPQIVKDLFDNDNLLRKAFLELHDEFIKLKNHVEELKKVGVKEYE